MPEVVDLSAMGKPVRRTGARLTAFAALPLIGRRFKTDPRFGYRLAPAGSRLSRVQLGG